MTAPVPDTSAAVEWLLAAIPDGPWLLAEINPHVVNPPVRATHITELDALRHYIAQRNGLTNLYWMPNATVPGLTTTPTKKDITLIRWLYGDLDLARNVPHDEEHKAPLLARCRALSPPPTGIVDSGGGFQPRYRIEPPYDPTYLDRIEATGKALCRALGSDAVQNVNRWLRLPGTVNIPNESKRARGRQVSLARVVEVDWSCTWSYNDPVPRLPDGYDEPVFPTSSAHGFADLPIKWQKLVKTGDASGYGDDRSSLVIALSMALARRCWSDDEILPFLIDERYGSSAHCLSKGDPRGVALRQIARARDKIAEAWDQTSHGKLDAYSPKNIRLAMAQMGVRFTHNVFSDRYYVTGAGPPRLLDDPLVSELRVSIHDRFGFLPGKDLLGDVTVTMSRASPYHPVCDYLSSLSHDGIARSETWLIDVAGAEDTPYVRAVSRLVLLAAVRRVRQPGCKFDEMLVFVDPTQGTEKSTAIAALAVRDEWFTDSFPLNASEKVAIEQLSGRWLVECSDLHGMKQADIDGVKAMMSRRYDRARPAYGRLEVTVARQSVLFGSTNATAFLRDVTNRRFWPVRTAQFNIPLLLAVRDQLWAEAAAIEATGVSIRLPEPLWDAANLAQENARYGDPWADFLLDHLANMTGRITINDCWRILGKPEHQRHSPDSGHLTEAMAELGWERSSQKFHGATQRCFVKGTKSERAQPIYVFRDPVTQQVSVGYTPTGFTSNADVPF